MHGRLACGNAQFRCVVSRKFPFSRHLADLAAERERQLTAARIKNTHKIVKIDSRPDYSAGSYVLK